MSSILDSGFFSSTTERDFFHLFCGEKLGAGMSREVWTFGLDDKYVVKFEIEGFHQNVAEWLMWCDAREMGSGVADWLAPCDRISSNGRILIQERTTPAKTFPDTMPVFLTDFKRTNYGMLGKRFVCHDYGTHLMCNSGLIKRRRKANWYDA